MSKEYEVLIRNLIIQYRFCNKSLTEKQMRILLDYFILRGGKI